MVHGPAVNIYSDRMGLGDTLGLADTDLMVKIRPSACQKEDQLEIAILRLISGYIGQRTNLLSFDITVVVCLLIAGPPIDCYL